jgi:hypothetical protein
MVFRDWKVGRSSGAPRTPLLPFSLTGLFGIPTYFTVEKVKLPIVKFLVALHTSTR